MTTGQTVSAYLLRVPSEKSTGTGLKDRVKDKAIEKEPDSEKYILCRQCHQPITRPVDRTAVEGAHSHTFANPHGIVFQIGCFRSVKGCGYANPASDEFSWFKGFSWRIAFCRTCLTHLGWLFTSVSHQSFYGLILDRLIDSN